MTTALAKYEAAKHALAAARSVDEVKDIRDKSIAMQAYAKLSKDRTLEADAAAIRMRAERRLGEMMKAQPKAKAGRHGNRVSAKPDSPATLAEAGIDKNLADRSRKAAAMPEEEFEKEIKRDQARIGRKQSAAKAAATRKKNRNEKRAAEKETQKARHPFSAPWITKAAELYVAAASDLKSHGFGTQSDAASLCHEMHEAILDAYVDLDYDEPVTGSAEISEDERRAEMEKLAKAES
jgi:hypothetical protein